MDAELKAKWVAALRSGNYAQTTGALRKTSSQGDGYCCLGVLCDVVGATWSREDDDGIWTAYFNHESEAGVLPATVANHVFGAYHIQDPRVRVYAENRNYETTLSVLNDDGKSFAEIADIIEEQL